MNAFGSDSDDEQKIEVDSGEYVIHHRERNNECVLLADDLGSEVAILCYHYPSGVAGLGRNLSKEQLDSFFEEYIMNIKKAEKNDDPSLTQGICIDIMGGDESRASIEDGRNFKYFVETMKKDMKHDDITIGPIDYSRFRGNLDEQNTHNLPDRGEDCYYGVNISTCTGLTSYITVSELELEM